MGSCRSYVVSNIFMNHFEELALVTHEIKPQLRPAHVKAAYVFWPHSPDELHDFFQPHQFSKTLHLVYYVLVTTKGLPGFTEILHISASEILNIIHRILKRDVALNMYCRQSG
jgi:hypothetical protein